jgi:hypothetical protein
VAVSPLIVPLGVEGANGLEMARAVLGEETVGKWPPPVTMAMEAGGTSVGLGTSNFDCKG